MCQISPLTYVSITVSVIPSLIRICPSFLPLFDLLPYYFFRQFIPVRAFPSSLPSASSILRQFYLPFLFLLPSIYISCFLHKTLHPQVMALFFFHLPVFSPSSNNLLNIILRLTQFMLYRSTFRNFLVSPFQLLLLCTVIIAINVEKGTNHKENLHSGT